MNVQFQQLDIAASFSEINNCQDEFFHADDFEPEADFELDFGRILKKVQDCIVSKMSYLVWVCGEVAENRAILEIKRFE